MNQVARTTPPNKPMEPTTLVMSMARRGSSAWRLRFVAGKQVVENWELTQFSAVFVAIGFAAGLAGGLGWHGTAQQYADGPRRAPRDPVSLTRPRARVATPPP